MGHAGLPLADGRVRFAFNGGRLTADAGVFVLTDIALNYIAAEPAFWIHT
jgi:hypothetical protein